MMYFLNFLNNKRNRDVWIINQLSNLPAKTRLLDAGAGESPYKEYCSQFQYTSQDFGQYNGTGDKVGLQTKQWDNSMLDIISDITAIPVKKDSYDAILCTEVLEHLPYPDKAIKEFARILKKKGKLIITSPFCSQTHFAPFHFCTGFSIYWYKQILKENNFRIISWEHNGNYFDFLAQELVRTPLVIRRYTPIGYLSFLTYIFIMPVLGLLTIMSVLNRGSETQLCFGYHVLAEKDTKR